MTSPQILPKLECPMTKVVDGCNFIEATVDHISPSGVYLEDKMISFDYLIVATGCSYSIPFDIIDYQPTFVSKEDRVFNQLKIKKQATIITPYSSKSILSSHYDVTHAKNIIIGNLMNLLNLVGGGPVGVECAGELAINLPKTKIELITNSTVLLERSPKNVQKAAYKMLSSYKNLEIHFNRYVSKVEGNKVYYKYKSNKNSTTDETFVESDAIIVCVGFRPNTSLFRSFMSDSLSESGYVCVNEYFQVQFQQNSYSTMELVQKTLEKLEDEKKNMIDKLEIDLNSKSSDTFDSLEETLNDDENTDFDESMLIESLKVTPNDSGNSSPFTILDKKSSSLSNPSLNRTSFFNSSRSSSFKTNVDEQSYFNIFSVGDIVNKDEEKICFYSHAHGEIVASNIIHLENSTSIKEFKKKVKPYVTNPNYMTIIAVGNQGIMVKGKTIIQKGKLALVAKNSLEKIFMSQYVPN
jgi:NADH dehydrogenase FAD-containing subunit